MKISYKNGGIFKDKKQALKYALLLARERNGTLYDNNTQKCYKFVTELTTTFFRWD